MFRAPNHKANRLLLLGWRQGRMGVVRMIYIPQFLERARKTLPSTFPFFSNSSLSICARK